MKRVYIALISLMLCGGCAGMSAANVGQTAGTIAGAAIVPGLGAPIGALVGLLAGLVVQGEVDKSTEKRERKELSGQISTKPIVPASEALAQPQGEPMRVWVDEKFEEGRLVAGHFDVHKAL